MMSINDDTRSQETQDMRLPNLPRPLTRQELHVLDLLGQGYTNEDIAGALDIAVSTVSSHVQHILKKLQVRNRVEAVLYIRHYGAQMNPLRAAASASAVRQPKKSARRNSFNARDPLLFLSQLNHVNWRIAQQGAFDIDYFGVSGAVSLAFYDPSTQQLKVHLSICGPSADELNVEVDELLWKYILEVAELSFSSSNLSPSPSPKKQPAFQSDERS
jgi:DNA-binding CsgD family transcriptional regulator